MLDADLAPVVAGFAGALAGGGALLLGTAVRGRPVGAGRPARRFRIDSPATRRSAAVGLGVGFGVLLLTRFLVLAVAVGVLAATWRRLFGGAASERAAMIRLDALASWTESLRDTVSGASGLEAAIPATALAASPVLRPALDRLVDRLRVRQPMPAALEQLAAEFDDPSADLVVAALLLNSRLRGPGLRDALSALAQSVREELDTRRRVEAGRRSTRRSVQIVVAITLAVASLLVVGNPRYVAPYGTFVGEAALALIVAIFAAGVLWLRRLADVEVPERFLAKLDGAS